MLWKIPPGYDISKFHSPTGYWNCINSLVFVYYMAVTNCAPPPGITHPQAQQTEIHDHILGRISSTAASPIHIFGKRTPAFVHNWDKKHKVGEVCFTRKTFLPYPSGLLHWQSLQYNPTYTDRIWMIFSDRICTFENCRNISGSDKNRITTCCINN